LRLVPYLVSVVAVAIVGIAAHLLTQLAPLPHVSVLFLAAVVMSAALWGFWPSVFTAVLSVAASSYFFYSPIYSFQVSEVQDLADLAVFIIVAAFTSRLSASVADARVRAQGEALREALLNSVSHDLQTPLAAILGSASALEALGERGDARGRAELVAAIREESERLASYIENLLDLTRIRAGQIAPRLELVELSDIVDAALRRKHKALGKHLVEVDLPADLPMLRLDLFLMEHAIANVLDNAAKYAPAGSAIGVSARVAGDEVALEVSDRGSGISAQDLARVFDPFYRGADAGEGAAAGAGLGLAICRAFVEANGGSVAVSSAGPGHGTRVRLRLPIAARSAAEESEAADD
jgi:two-component system sensor histidine kinase KdpD